MLFYIFFFFNDTATTEIYTLSLHDALPIYDLLDKDPRDTFTNTPAFWSNANEVESYSNGFYSFYGTASSFYFNALNDDQASPDFADWDFTTIPNKASAWNSRFTNIRQIGRASCRERV